MGVFINDISKESLINLLNIANITFNEDSLVEIKEPHGRIIDEDELMIFEPCFGTDEWIQDLMTKYNLNYEHNQAEDDIYNFAIDLCQGFLNIITTANTVLEANYSI